MAYEVSRIDVWAGDIENRPGALADKLAGLKTAGASLDFVIVRRSDQEPGLGVLFVAPLRGEREIHAAEEAGLAKAPDMHSIRLEVPDRPGLAAGITKTMAEAGLNIHGLTTAAIGDRAVVYIAFETDAEAARATQVLTSYLA